MTAEKKRYYISVAHQVIQDEPGDSSEFAVMLTDEELKDLKYRMDALEKDDEYTFKRAVVPFKSADHDDSTEEFDDKLIGIYAYIYERGDANTKRMIDEMNVLSKLGHTDYHDTGYENSPLNK